jgi:ATP-binding cassette subfamily F protein uup
VKSAYQVASATACCWPSCLPSPANILVLDEPTNDLDIDTQELLEELLRDYDRAPCFWSATTVCFIDNVITQSIVFEGKAA